MSVQIEWLKAYDDYQTALAGVAHRSEMVDMIPTHFKAHETATGHLKEAVEVLVQKTKAFEELNAQLAVELRSSSSVIMQLSRDEAIQMLGDFMSQISEDIWSAGWMGALEDIIPAAVADVLSGKKERDIVTLEQAKQLKALADYLGHWVEYNMGDGPTYIPYTPAAP